MAMQWSRAHAAWKPLGRACRLATWRLGTTRYWAVARTLCLLTSLFFTLSVLYLGTKGLGLAVASVTVRAALVSAWLGGGIVAWWNAGDRALADANDGIEALGQCHGVSANVLQWARALVAWAHVAALVFVTSLPVALAAIAVAPSVTLALHRTAALLLLAAFAAAVGLVAGALASACGLLSPRHGRALLFALICIPYALQGASGSGRGINSIPGLLAGLLHMIRHLGAGT